MFDKQENDAEVLDHVTFSIEDEEYMTDQIANQIAGAVHRAGNDLQIFTGKEFETNPSLLITDQLTDTDEERGMPAGYGTLFHQIAFSNKIPAIDQKYEEEGKIEEENDFLYALAVEEMTHALQADQLGLKGKSGKAKKMLGNYISRFNDMPDFDAEGFSDWTAEHLGNFSFWDYREDQLQEIYNTPISEISATEIEPENEKQRAKLEEQIEKTAQRTIEAYTGHAYYKAFNQMNNLDDTIEEGFTPTRPGEIDQVLETIEESDVDPVLYDEIVRPYWDDEDIDWGL